MMRVIRAVVILSVGVALGACGGNSLKKAGESCTASSECDKGLLCDTAQHVCAGKGSVDAFVEPIDAPKGVDAKPIDAKPIDAKPIDAALPDAPPDTM
jgi:hypothetical protein